MKRGLLVTVVAAFVLLGLYGCSSVGRAGGADTSTTERVELRVSAATTLKRPIEELASAFESAHPGVSVVGNYAASGVLQRQIEQGAPADVFLSASPKQIDALTAQGLIASEATATLCGNDVAIVVPANDPHGIEAPEDLARAGRLSLGNPLTVPAGTKAKEWLLNIGRWESLEPRLVFGENAAQVLDYTARGEVDAAIVFASEATGNPAVRVVYRAPGDQLTSPVRYVMAPVNGSSQRALAAEFVEFMQAAEAQDALGRWGFRPLAEMD